MSPRILWGNSICRLQNQSQVGVAVGGSTSLPLHPSPLRLQVASLRYERQEAEPGTIPFPGGLSCRSTYLPSQKASDPGQFLEDIQWPDLWSTQTAQGNGP